MRLILAIVMLAVSAYGSILYDPPHIYTNLIGSTFINETVNRDRWIGGEWVKVTPYVVGGVMYDATNCIGDIWYGSPTSTIPFTATDADEITHHLDSVMPRYTMPYYSTEPQYSFDVWFSNGLSRFPNEGLGNFKADMFSRYPVCGITTSTNIQGDVSLNGTTNSYGEISGNGWWINARNRKSPLIVSEWGMRFEETIDGSAYYKFDYLAGRPNRYTDGSLQLFGLSTNQYPMFCVNPGILPANTWSLTLTPEQSDIDIVNTYSFNGHDLSVYEWASNKLSNLSFDLYNQHDLGSPIVLTQLFTRCDRAWLAMGGPWVLDGVGASNATVSLKYTNSFNIYEGTTVWSDELMPEQLIAHGCAFSNMFLVPWTNTFWTNSIVSTGAWYIASNSVPFWNDSVVNSNCTVLEKDRIPVTGGQDCITGWPSFWIWRTNWPIFHALLSVDDPPPIGIFVSGQYTNPVPEQPSWTNSLYGIGSIGETGSFHTADSVLDGSLDINWESYFQRYEQAIMTTGQYRNVKSGLAVGGLYTGTPHRVHVYAKFAMDTDEGENIYYHRIGVFPTNFVSDSVIVTTNIDISGDTNMNLGFNYSSNVTFPSAVYNYYGTNLWTQGDYYFHDLGDGNDSVYNWTQTVSSVTNSQDWLGAGINELYYSITNYDVESGYTNIINGYYPVIVFHTNTVSETPSTWACWTYVGNTNPVVPFIPPNPAWEPLVKIINVSEEHIQNEPYPIVEDISTNDVTIVYSVMWYDLDVSTNKTLTEVPSGGVRYDTQYLWYWTGDPDWWRGATEFPRMTPASDYAGDEAFWYDSSLGQWAVLWENVWGPPPIAPLQYCDGAIGSESHVQSIIPYTNINSGAYKVLIEWKREDIPL